MKLLLGFGLMVVMSASGCVTLSGNGLSEGKADGFSFTCSEDYRISEPGILALGCSFVAAKDNIPSIKVSTVHFNDSDAQVMSPVEIQKFFAGQQEKSQGEMPVGAVVLGGVAGGSNEGAALAIAVAGTFVVLNRMGTGEKGIDPKYSDQHILGGPFAVTTATPVAKNLLVRFPAQDRVPAQLTLCFSEPGNECLTVDILLNPTRSRARKG